MSRNISIDSAATPPGSSNCFSRCDRFPRVSVRDPGLMALTPPGSHAVIPVRPIAGDASGSHVIIPAGCQPLAGGGGASATPPPVTMRNTFSDPNGVAALPGCDLSEVVDLPTRTPRVARRDPGLMALTPPGSHAVIPVRPIAGDASGSHVIIPAGCQPLAGGGGASATPPPVTMRNTFSDPNGVAALPGCDLSEVVDLPTRTPPGRGRDPGLMALTPPGSHAVIPVRPIAGDASGSHVIIPAGCQPLAGGGGASATPPPVTMRNTFSDPNGVAALPGCDLSEVVDLPTRTPRVARRDPGLMALTPPGSHAVIPVRPIAGDASGSHVIIPAGCQPLAGGGGASATPPTPANH